MNCNDYREMLSLYIDNKLDENGIEKITEHLKNCNSCRLEYETLLEMRELLLETDLVDLPEGFKEELHGKLVATTQDEIVHDNTDNAEELTKVTPIKKKKKVNWKIFSAVAALFVIMVISIPILQQLGMGTEKNYEMAQDSAPEYGIANTKMAAPEAPAEEMPRQPDMDSNQLMDNGQGIANVSEVPTREIAESQEAGRKIILNSYVRLDVTEYDSIHDQIINLAVSRGGFVQSSNTRFKNFNRNQQEESLKEGEVILRVPENEFYNTYNDIKSLGTVIDSSINTTDITSEYRDTVNEVENLKIQENSLRTIMEKATNVSEILQVERELARVRGDINRLTGNVKKWDNLVNLSTIDVRLNEVSDDTFSIKTLDEGIWTQSKKGFVETTNKVIKFFEGMFVKIISSLPVILIGLILLIVTLFIVKRIRMNK